jgi:hypothetical protein
MKLGHKTSDFSPRFSTSSIKHQTSSDCTGGRVTMLFDTASQNKIQETGL